MKTTTVSGSWGSLRPTQGEEGTTTLWRQSFKVTAASIRPVVNMSCHVFLFVSIIYCNPRMAAYCEVPSLPSNLPYWWFWIFAWIRIRNKWIVFSNYLINLLNCLWKRKNTFLLLLLLLLFLTIILYLWPWCPGVLSLRPLEITLLRAK